MKRTVVGFTRHGDKVTIALNDAPLRIDGMHDTDVIDLPDVAGGPRERGAALLARLCTHPPVRAGLQAALAMPMGSPPSPLYFGVRAARADAMLWELIHADGAGFCALDPRWPIGRIATERSAVTPRGLAPPLRVVAVLSATANRTGVPQLRALVRAAAAPRYAALNVRVHVISGEPAVLTAAVGPKVTSQTIAANGPALADQINAARPHILHTLCHSGGDVGGERVLAFGHTADFDEPELACGSVKLAAAELVRALQSFGPLLVVLGACETGETGQDGPALAHAIACGGIPAVIGMRRMVDLRTADTFCAELYPEVFDLLNEALAQQVNGRSDIVTIDWASVLTTPRQVLSGGSFGHDDAWTDPVLYVQDEPLRILPAQTSAATEALRVAEARAAKQGKLDTLRGALASLDPATAPPGLIADLHERIAQLKAELADSG